MGCGSSVGGQVVNNQELELLKVELSVVGQPTLIEQGTRGIKSKDEKKQLALYFFTLQKTHDKKLVIGEQESPQNFDFQLRKDEVIIKCQLCYDEQIKSKDGDPIPLTVVIGEGAFALNKYQEQQQRKIILFYEGKKTAELEIKAKLLPLPQQPQQPQDIQNQDSNRIFFEANTLTVAKDKITSNSNLLLTLRYGDEIQNLIKSIQVDMEKFQVIQVNEWTFFNLKDKETPIYIEVWLQKTQGTDILIGLGYAIITDKPIMDLELINNGENVGSMKIKCNVIKSADITQSGNQQTQQITFKVGDKSYIESYQGQVQNNSEYEGKGILTVGKQKYDGSFVNGKKQGQGKLSSLEDLLYYDGRWKNNTFDGNGEWNFNGKKKPGVWENGNRLCWKDDEQNAIYSGRSVSAGFMLKSQNQLFTMFFANDGNLYIIHNQTKQAVFAICKANNVEKPFSLELDLNGQLNFRDKKAIYYSPTKEAKSPASTASTLALFDDGRLVIQDTATLDIIWESQSLF